MGSGAVRSNGLPRAEEPPRSRRASLDGGIRRELYWKSAEPKDMDGNTDEHAK
jgi:hypothetical protein